MYLFRDSWRPCAQAIDCVHGRRLSVHEMTDGGVHQPLDFQYAFSGEHRRCHLDGVVAGSAAVVSPAWLLSLPGSGPSSAPHWSGLSPMT